MFVNTAPPPHKHHSVRLRYSSTSGQQPTGVTTFLGGPLATDMLLGPNFFTLIQLKDQPFWLELKDPLRKGLCMSFHQKLIVGRLSYFMPKAVAQLLVSISLLAPLSTVKANPTEGTGMGLLTEHLFLGPVEGWSGAIDHGAYWLTNEAGNADDIRYFYTALDDQNNGKRAVEVELLTKKMDANARAGLLYGYRDSPRLYYLIVAGKDGQLDVYERNGNSFRQSLSSSFDMASDGVVRLKAQEDGQQLSITVNGKNVSKLENNFIGKGQLGIAVFGLGQFGFTNYVQTPAQTATPSNPNNTNPLSRNPLSRRFSTQDNPLSAKRSELKFLEFMDPETRMVQYRTPYPSGWALDNNPNDQLVATGPGKTEVYQTSSGQFYYSDDPFARESAARAGGQVSRPISIEQYLQQVYRPYMEQRGFAFKNSFHLPKIQQFWELFSAGMPQGLSQRSYQVLGADWTTRNGTQACTVLVMNMLRQQTYVSWSVWVGELYAPDPVFEPSKAAYLYASANTELNPQ